MRPGFLPSGDLGASQPHDDEEQVMTTFTVWKFDDPDGAGQTVDLLKHAESDGLVKVVDHTVVSWPEGASRPETKTRHDDKRRGTAWGAFLGALVGMLFFAPVVGGAIGAGIGRAMKGSEGTGIDKEDLERIRAEVTPGTSALFLVTEEGDLDRLGERFHGMNSKLITTNLTSAERETLVETFGGA
jgi:uncharacterized membrane protein